MDSITQIVLGAGVGEAILGKKVGNKAILWGAVLGTVPDLDVFAGVFMNTVNQMTFHRAFSHSLLFFFLAAPLFGWLIHKIHKKKEASVWQWTVFAFWVLLTHSLLDCFTSWGTQLFWPLDYRVAFHTIFVVDPLYTIPFLISIIVLMFYNRQRKTRKWINYAGLGISSLYLLFTTVTKFTVDPVFKQALAQQNIQYERFQSKPTPLNSILWWVIAEDDENYYMGYYSLLDKSKKIEFREVDKNHDLLKNVKENKDLLRLFWMMDHYYAVEKSGDGILIHDARFGQAVDFETGEGDFVFSFIVKLKEDGKDPKEIEDIVQMPRDMEPTSEMFRALWERIKGIG